MIPATTLAQDWLVAVLWWGLVALVLGLAWIWRR